MEEWLFVICLDKKIKLRHKFQPIKIIIKAKKKTSN